MAKQTAWTAKRIKSLRERLGLTQKAAAERARVALRTWASWEGGERTPSGPATMILDQLNAEAPSR